MLLKGAQGATETKRLKSGSIYQQYVYTCFLVKIDFNFGSFGSFFIYMGQG